MFFQPCFNPSQYHLLICCQSFSPANHLLLKNQRSLVQICINSSLESTSRFIPSASPVTSHVSIHLLIRLSTHLSHHPRSHHPSLLHSFTPGSNLPFHEIFPALNRLLLRFDNGTGPNPSRSSVHF